MAKVKTTEEREIKVIIEPVDDREAAQGGMRVSVDGRPVFVPFGIPCIMPVKLYKRLEAMKMPTKHHKPFASLQEVMDKYQVDANRARQMIKDGEVGQSGYRWKNKYFIKKI